MGEGLPSGPPRPPNGIQLIRIYIKSIRGASPPNNNLVSVDSFDDVAIRHNVGHEIGHGINMPHRDPYLPLSVMIRFYLQTTSNINDPAWNNVPHNYDEIIDIIPYLRLK
jgi:hypothetical protein